MNIAMISYAQNFEDVILWRALRDILDGTYVDVGAFHPERDSVTKWFYDSGWSGINIEPLDQNFALFAEARNRDINLNCLVGNSESTGTLYEIDNTGLSTTIEDIANRHAKSGYEIRPHQIVQFTLNKICGDYLSGKDIHFLKVDVEGGELEALSGIDLALFRPWIIIVEAIDPIFHLRSDSAIIELMSRNKYEFAWFDGLNSFFVAIEHNNLKELIALPPNIFDNFSRNTELIRLRPKAVGELDARMLRSIPKYIPDLKPDLESIYLKLNNINSQIEALNQSILKSNVWFGKKIEIMIRKKYWKARNYTRPLFRKFREIGRKVRAKFAENFKVFKSKRNLEYDQSTDEQKLNLTPHGKRVFDRLNFKPQTSANRNHL
jgi:FkbM family methyltransferase